MDRRAREYVAANQKLLASDLIFSDGLETTEEIIAALEQVRYVESADRAAARAAARRQQLIFTGAAGAIALLVMILLAQTPSDEEGAAVAPAAFQARIPDEAEPAARRTGKLRRRNSSSALRAPQRLLPRFPSTESGAWAALPDLRPDIETVAEVCSELARLSDTAGAAFVAEKGSDRA